MLLLSQKPWDSLHSKLQRQLSNVLPLGGAVRRSCSAGCLQLWWGRVPVRGPRGGEEAHGQRAGVDDAHLWEVAGGQSQGRWREHSCSIAWGTVRQTNVFACKDIGGRAMLAAGGLGLSALHPKPPPPLPLPC